jgi:hypothetical protein
MKRKADTSNTALEAGEDEVLCCGCGGYFVVVLELCCLVLELSCAFGFTMLVFVLSCVCLTRGFLVLVLWLPCLVLMVVLCFCLSCFVVVLSCGLVLWLSCVVCFVLCCFALCCLVFCCLVSSCLVLSCLGLKLFPAGSADPSGPALSFCLVLPCPVSCRVVSKLNCSCNQGCRFA